MMEISIEHYNKMAERLTELEYLVAECKTGRWIDMGDFEQCSVCTGTHLKEMQTMYGKAIWIRTPYCPNCGARMIKGEEHG